MGNQVVIIIRLRAYEHDILDDAARQIVKHAESTGARVVGPIPLPVSIKKFTVNRSPHVNKKSREVFELRCHQRLFEIHDSTQETTNSLMKVDLAAGVDVEIKLKGDVA